MSITTIKETNDESDWKKSDFSKFLDWFTDNFDPLSENISRTITIIKNWQNIADSELENKDWYKRETIQISSDIVKNIFQILDLEFDRTFLLRQEFKLKLIDIFNLNDDKVSIIQKDWNIRIIKAAQKEKRLDWFSRTQIHTDIKEYLKDEYNKQVFFSELIDSLDFSEYNELDFIKFIEGEYLNLLHKALINKNLVFYNDSSLEDLMINSLDLDKVAASWIGLDTLRENFTYVINILSIKLNDFFLNNNLNSDLLDVFIKKYTKNKYDKLLTNIDSKDSFNNIESFYVNFKEIFIKDLSNILIKELSKHYSFNWLHDALLKWLSNEYYNIAVNELKDLILEDLQKDDKLLNNKLKLLFSYFSWNTIWKIKYPKLNFSDIKSENYTSEYFVNKLIENSLSYKEAFNNLNKVNTKKEEKNDEGIKIHKRLDKIDSKIDSENDKLLDIKKEIADYEVIIKTYKDDKVKIKENILKKIINKKDEQLETHKSNLLELINDEHTINFRIKQFDSDKATVLSLLKNLDTSLENIEKNIERKQKIFNEINAIYIRIKKDLVKNILNATKTRKPKK